MDKVNESIVGVSKLVTSNEKSDVTFFDSLLASSVLKLIPNWILPNYVTFIRFCMVPSVIYFLFAGRYKLALLLFIIAAFTDALDGAMARTRNQITDWGKIYDPLADKLLIGSVAIVLLGRFIWAGAIVIIVVIEAVLIAQAAYQRYIKRKIVQAMLAGKIKMILQVIGVGLVFLFAILGGDWLLVSANIILYTSIIFALISLIVYRSV